MNLKHTAFLFQLMKETSLMHFMNFARSLVRFLFLFLLRRMTLQLVNAENCCNDFLLSRFSTAVEKEELDLAQRVEKILPGVPN